MPRVWDSLSATRFTSFFTCIPALAIFGAPILYFGVSERGYGTNLGLVGTLMLVLAFTRILWPGWSTAASYLNSLLGAWVIISPWIFGYTDWLALTVLSVGAGAAVIGMSLFSASFTRPLRPGEY
jgi:hypothetical protein